VDKASIYLLTDIFKNLSRPVNISAYDPLIFPFTKKETESQRSYVTFNITQKGRQQYKDEDCSLLWVLGNLFGL
jgi:hypothetical protein